MTEITFKKFNELSTEELYETMRLREEVFIVEQTCIYPDLDDRDYDCIHVIARDTDAGKWRDGKGEITGYLRILPAGQTFDTVAIGRVLVRESNRRDGIARKMLNETLDYVRNVMGETHLKLSAQQYLTGFYGSLGFRIISEGYLEDGIPHIDMEILL